MGELDHDPGRDDLRGVGIPEMSGEERNEGTESLPAGVEEMARRYVEDLVLGSNRDPQATLDFVQS
jgi:hypothetical protein